jgi:hypothetical protein
LDDARWLALYIKRNLLKSLETQRLQSHRPNQLKNNIVDCKAMDQTLISFEPSEGAMPTKDISLLDNRNIFDEKGFKSHLKAKFAELLRVGYLLIENDVADELDHASAFNEAQTSHLPALSKITSSSDMASAIEMITKLPAPSDITNEALSSQFIACVNMVNELARQLSEIQQKPALDFASISSAEVFSRSSRTSLFQALEVHDEVKTKLNSKLSEGSVTKSKYFSLQN